MPVAIPVSSSLRRRWVRPLVATAALILLSARCDCFYPYHEECKGLDEAACAAKSEEVVGWTQAHCVVVRDDGRFVRCRPLHNTGCGF